MDTSTESSTPAVDWARLRSMATEAAQRSRAPYSKLRVGAAALLDDGRTVTGCNVESASYGLTLCAECGLVSAAQLLGGKLVAVSVTDHHGDLLVPCGRCRQLLHEMGGPGLILEAEGGTTTIADLLPSAFTDDDLPETGR